MSKRRKKTKSKLEEANRQEFDSNITRAVGALVISMLCAFLMLIGYLATPKEVIADVSPRPVTQYIPKDGECILWDDSWVKVKNTDWTRPQAVQHAHYQQDTERISSKDVLIL